MIWRSITILVIAILHYTTGCQFYPPGEYLRFVRVPENLQVGQEVLRVNVYPRNSLHLLPVDKDEDVQYFTYRDLNRTTVSLLLARSLEDLVDTENPRNVLKFKVACDYDDGEDIISSSLSITVYVEDINDHAPVFYGAPYQVSVDELTPAGLTIFRGIKAVDRDKPNTPNSDVQYAIVAGNERGKFSLDSSHQAFLILKKPLDFDTGDREFALTIAASDRGVPPRSSNTTIRIVVNDNDDLSPKFTKGVYRTKIPEFYPIIGERIHARLEFDPPIYAFDQDVEIDTPIRYSIIAGNERHLFSMDHVNGSLFLETEVDLDAERSLPGNTFVLQIQAAQMDNPLKTGVARVEVEIMDLNDNLPEFEVDFYNISIVENLPNGFSVLQIIATDQDQGDNADFSYQLNDPSGAFTLDSRTGWLTVRDQSILDREKRPSITMQVHAKEKVQSVVTTKEGASFVSIEVTLLDANDNNPSFVPTNLYDFVISSDVKKGASFGKVRAVDPDLGRNGMVLYSIQTAANNTIPFQIEPNNGNLYVSNPSLLSNGKHLLFVEAFDQPLNPSERRSALAVVSVEVQNSNAKGAGKGYPDFVGAPYEFWVGGNVDVGTSVGQIRVSDVVDRSKIMYDLLHSYHEGVPFAVEEKSGTITVVNPLPSFKRTNFDFEAVVTNERDIYLVTNVTIHVVDPKDEKTILMKSNSKPIEFHVKENHPNILIGKLGFKNSSTSTLKFSIANQKDVTDHISITSDGTLYTQKSLDRETRDIYRLTVIAEFNKGQVTGTGIYQVTVFVDDENDNKPLFERESYEGKIRENCISGTEVDLNYLIHVNDKDIGENGLVTITISGVGNEKFRLDKTAGRLYFTSASTPIDREKMSVYHLKLIARDKGDLSSDANLTILVEDENDNAPMITQMVLHLDKGVQVIDNDKSGNKIGHFEELKNATMGTYILTNPNIRTRRSKDKISPLISLPEDINVGNTIIKLVAEDPDLGDNAAIKYEMVSETYIPNEFSQGPFHTTQYFIVHPVSGEVSVSRFLPPESEFRLNISATDKGDLKDHITMRILIRDVNNHPPVFKKSWYIFDAEEATYHKKTLGVIEASDNDYGSNANITYYIKPKSNEVLPFFISAKTGILTVNGVLDRELKDKYTFSVVAKDNPKDGTKSLKSTVNVEVNILDVNDNPPIFYGYDDVFLNINANTYNNHNYQEKLPVYYATVSENSPIGTPITKVFANDSDFSGNGNGLILFNIPYRKNRQNLFAIDSKEGVVTNIGKLDYETEKSHNVTIVASDLGSPSMSSAAVLIVNVIDVPEDLKTMNHPLFAHRYYEVEVEENIPVPLKLLTLNVTETYQNQKLKYSIVSEDKIILKTFRIDPKNGTLFITQSPDREKRSLYELVVRVEQYKVGRDMTVVVYPVTNERLGSLGLNEVKVIVRVTDLNDNIPKFTITGRPIVAAIPTNANYGYHVLRMQAKDPDLGLNGEVRYQILGRADEASRRFSIDPVTGQVRAISGFTRDGGKVYGFDVKATDRRGADDGKSSIANVFVYVLDDQKQLVMVMGMKPVDVEKSMDNITMALYNATGFDVRVRKLEPHSEHNQIDSSATDMYLYAVDPLLNTVVEMDDLQKLLQLKHNDIEKNLEGPKVLAVASGIVEKNRARSQRVLLSTLEVGVVVLGCIVFLGALATAICVMCVRRKKRRHLQESFGTPLGYAFGTDPLGKPTLFPTNFAENNNYACDIRRSSNDLSKSKNGFSMQKHDVACPRLIRPSLRERSRSSGALKSITSLHSSGQDSGIVDAVQCHCERSTSQSSEESSSYEDSLQSVPHGRGHRGPSIRRPNPVCYQNSQQQQNPQQRRSRNRSITEDIVHLGGLQRIHSTGHLPSVGVVGPSALRRSTERLMMG